MVLQSNGNTIEFQVLTPSTNLKRSVCIIIILLLIQSVQGDYVLRVRPSGYANPDNTCHQCFSQGLIFPGCCDLFDTFSCSGDLLCDNEFFYCLIPIDSESRYSVDESSVGVRNISTRADQLGCLQPPSALRSITNFNGRAINFASDTVLGLPNPLEFEVTSVSWQVWNVGWKILWGRVLCYRGSVMNLALLYIITVTLSTMNAKWLQEQPRGHESTWGP